MSSGFITESEAAESRRRRQEEWERVRKPEDPLERPEEPYDGRSLYERLKEQKVKKDLDYEEAHKLKNLIRGLDDDEVQFLELVDKQKINAELKQAKEEAQELQDFRNRVATLQEEYADKRLQAEIKSSKLYLGPSTSAARPSQKALLGLGIKRKNGDTTQQPATKTTESEAKVAEPNTQLKNTDEKLISITTNQYDIGALRCVAILPGIGSYTESSDSEVSSGSGDDIEIHGNYDLCGRKRLKKSHFHDDS